jgi:hypothetical protein
MARISQEVVKGVSTPGKVERNLLGPVAIFSNFFALRGALSNR